MICYNLIVLLASASALAFHCFTPLNSRVTQEELCVTDADAISHFDNVPSLLYLAYVNKKLDINEGREFVRNKLIRSYEKLSDKSKMLYRTKFDQVMNVLN